MGYFSNGTEGMAYEAHYCDKCIHRGSETGGCGVWLAHMLRNYDDCNDENSILHLLIPRNKEGWNEQCTMFVEGSVVKPDVAKLPPFHRMTPERIAWVKARL